MGDPFSATGTAVGITSLGLQTCQIIHKYYSDFKGYHDDIDSILRHAEGVQSILESLHQLKDRLAKIDDTARSQLQLALNACEDALHALKRTADKCVVSKQAQGVQARVREVQKRMLWPYKKETIADLQAKLKAFQVILSLGVQSAGLERLLQKFDDINPTIAAVHGQTTVMKQDLAIHTETLNTLRLGVADAALVRHQQHENVSKELFKLQTQSLQQHTVTEHKLDLLVAALRSYQDASTVPPSLLASSVQMLRAIQCQTSDSIVRQQPTNLHKSFRSPYPFCNCRQKKTQTIDKRRWISFISEEVHHHHPSCTYHAHEDRSRTSAAKFNISIGLVSFCVQAGWQRSKRGGWNSIAPVLRYRATVPRGTGAFGIIDNGTKALDYCGWRMTQDEVSELLVTTTIALQRIFHTDASPYDVDVDGMSLLSEALTLAYAAISHGSRAGSAICDLLDVCNAPGISHTNTGAFFSPMKYWQFFMESFEQLCFRKETGQGSACESVLRYLAQNSGEWVVFDPVAIWVPNTQEFYDSISDMLTLENMDHYLIEDDPLLVAILKRSESEFATYLSASNPTASTSSFQASHARALVTWPEGLIMLTSLGLLTISDALVDLLWEYASQALSLRSIQVLTSYKRRYSSKDWYDLNRACRGVIEEKIRLSRASVGERALDEVQWAGVLDTAAAKLQPGSVTVPSVEDENINQATGVFPYHSIHLSGLGAKSAWKAGYRDLDTPYWWLNNDQTSQFGTPLWLHSCSSRYDDGDVARWLLGHGANPFWSHPDFLTTPAHIIARQARSTAISNNNISTLKEFEHFLTSPAHDRCKCFCSQYGCSSIACAISRYGPNWWRIENDPEWAKSQHQIVRPYLFILVDQYKDDPWMSTAVFRIMTFEKLSLTHTCCYRILEELVGQVQHPTAEEARVMHEIERDDVELLDTLVAEFEEKWARYDRPFVTFMNRVWRKRMSQVKEERRVDEETYEAELLRMGVTLEEEDEEDEEDFAYFWKVQSRKDAEQVELIDMMDWPDDYESEDGQDGWYTTDEEEEEEDEVKELDEHRDL